MATYSASDFRSGLKVMLDGDPCAIVENELVKPEKGQAFARVRLRNLKPTACGSVRLNLAKPWKVPM